MKRQTLGILILLILLLFTAFLIRIQGTPHIPEGQFTSNDAYFYYWQASLISEHGHLPDRDMHRWVPLGRDLGQTLNLYGYVLAYTHKALASVFPNVTLYQVSLYAPPLCFCIGLGVLCLFLFHTHGLLFSGIVGIFLVTLPGSIERSTTGFSDRDAFCLMLGILAVVTYLASLQAGTPRKKQGWMLVSGFTVFLGGISWEGFGVFLSIILIVELWRFLSSETENNLGLYLLWMCCFVPTLYLASPAYRDGYGFAEHLFAFMLLPPVVLLGIRALRYLLISKVEKLRPHARALAFGLTLTSIALSLGYVLIHLDTFADTTVPLSQNALMQNIAELYNPSLTHWMIRYGSVFILGCLGIAMASIRLGKKHGLLLVVPLCIFTLTSFYRSRLDELWGTTIGNLLFGIAIAICCLGILTLAWRKKIKTDNEYAYVMFFSWFLFWVILTRDAKRYDFFIGLSISFFTADLICYLADFYANQVKRYKPWIIKTAITTCLLVPILFWQPVGGHATRTLLSATTMRRALPGSGDLTQALYWIKANLPPTAVTASSWSYGSLLNVLGGVKTIIDQDHYLQHWIHLYNRHVYCANTVQEALEFLKTHEATHIILDARDTIFNAPYYSNLASDENGDKRFTITPLERGSPKAMKYQAVPHSQSNIPIESIDFDLAENILTVKAQLRTGETFLMPAVAFINQQRVTAKEINAHGGILIVFDESQNPAAAYYIPSVGWDSLAIRLYFRGEMSNIFVPIYPTSKNAAAHFKIWEIHYPPDIKPNPKYLKTGYPEIDKDLPLQ